MTFLPLASGSLQPASSPAPRSWYVSPTGGPELGATACQASCISFAFGRPAATVQLGSPTPGPMQALLHFCRPQLWPDSQPSPGALLEAVIRLGSVELLVLLLNYLPEVATAAAMQQRKGETLSSVFLYALTAAVAKLRTAPDPDPQVGMLFAVPPLHSRPPAPSVLG